jgi:hypothetical protein
VRRRRRAGTASLLGSAASLSTAALARAQDTPPATEPAAAGVSAAQLAKANNPLADMNALNFHDYWSSALRAVPDDYSNTLNLRPVMMAGRHIIRATIPLPTVPLGGGPYASVWATSTCSTRSG